MLEHIAEFTAWPILTGIFIGYIANRIMSGEGKGCCMDRDNNRALVLKHPRISSWALSAAMPEPS